MGDARFIVVGGLIDGSGGKVRRNAFLKVEDGIISAIGPAADLPTGEGLVIDDLSHCSIVPALVDCSVSLLRSPAVDEALRLSCEEAGPEERAAILGRHIRYCSAYGVLGLAADDVVRDLLDHYKVGMPLASPIVLRTSGGLCQSARDYPADPPANGDFLKIVYSGNIEDKGGQNPRLRHQDLCRILRGRGRKKAVVVANGRQAVEEALAAGCDAVEQGYGMGEENLKKMAAKAVLWIPSVLRAKNALDGASSDGGVGCRFSLRYVAPGKPEPGAEAFWQKMLTEQLRQLRLAQKIGVKTAVGTGAGSVGILHGESVVEEMKLFLKAGYLLEEAIRCASENGARFFGMERLGSLMVGRKATFLLVRGTAQQLPRKLSYLEGIYVDGAPSVVYRKN